MISQKIVHEKLTQKQEKQKYFFDKSKRNLNELKPGDTVRVQSEKKWEPGVVVQKADTPRSYHVQTQRGSYRRNRKHLIKTNENPTNIDRDLDFDDQGGKQFRKHTIDRTTGRRFRSKAIRNSIRESRASTGDIQRLCHIHIENPGQLYIVLQ